MAVRVGAKARVGRFRTQDYGGAMGSRDATGVVAKSQARVAINCLGSQAIVEQSMLV